MKASKYKVGSIWYIDMGCGIYMAEILGKGHDDTEVYIKVHGWLGSTFNCKKHSLMTREEAENISRKLFTNY